MTASKLRVLIIDDNVFKTFDIKKALEFCGVREISSVYDQESAWEELGRSEVAGRGFDLIVTDMHYPINRGEEADWRAGKILLEELENRGIRIPVIVCSSINHTIPHAFGCVWYSNLNENMQFDFQDLIAKLT